MAWKGLHLSRAAYLHTERGSLSIDFRDDLEPAKFRLPLEDLAWLVLDSPQILLSSALLSRCSDAGVMILGVDEKHLPCWTSLPWTRFHKQGEVMRLQLEASLPRKKRLWQEIVRLKILAQAASLESLGRQKAPHLRALASAVRSGDPDNTEARAAQLYFRCLFLERAFTRHADDLPNYMLDYGYAVIRASIARNLCAIGFIPQLGLHHCGLANAYNLADDLIEPYRPFVDALAVRILGDRLSSEPFLTEDRRAIVSILDRDVLVNGQTVTLFHAIGLTVASLKGAMRDGDSALLSFPEPTP
jgi:CRISPR-associated protein Cas1